MGRSDPFIRPFIAKRAPKSPPIAMLGSTRDDIGLGYDVDLYDLQLNNWNINSEWVLNRKYMGIISTKCPHFAKDPCDFIERCAHYLEPGGELCVSWELGDHYRFDNYKVGWVKDGEHEYAYAPDNFLWSALWSKSFMADPVCADFAQLIKKFGYDDLNKAILDEVPSILDPCELFYSFTDVTISFMRMWEKRPQLYIMASAKKKTALPVKVTIEIGGENSVTTSALVTT